MDKSQVSALTTLGDTVKTLVGEVQVPQGAKRIKGISAQAIAAGTMTTAETLSGILELESPDINLVPSQWMLDCVSALTSGAIAYSPRIYPVDIPVKGGEKISGYITLDMAWTGANKGRFQLIYEF